MHRIGQFTNLMQSDQCPGGVAKPLRSRLNACHSAAFEVIACVIVAAASVAIIYSGFRLPGGSRDSKEARRRLLHSHVVDRAQMLDMLRPADSNLLQLLRTCTMEQSPV